MNLGELKVNPVGFNSQVQLNNDWFVSKNEETSSFENILANKAKERSVVKREFEPKESLKFEKKVAVERPVDQAKPKENNQLSALKEKVNEVIAKKKFNKENDVETVDSKSLKELEAKLEALEDAIKEELGLTEKPEVLELMAQLLGINVEALIEQLSSGDTEVVEELTDLITVKLEDGTINPKELVKDLKQVFVKSDLPEQVELEKVVAELVDKLPEGEIRNELIQFEAVMESILQEKVPETALPVEEVKMDGVKNDNPITEPIVINEKVEVVEAKQTSDTSTQQEQSTEKQAEPLSNIAVKTETKEVVQKFSLEDQVNLMKAESTTIISTKVTPKAALTRSVMNQVIQGTKMSINMSDQGSEILVKLNPKNLGNVALKMAFEKGTLLAQIQVENQTVKGIIESNLDDLKSALRDEGYEIGDLDVSVNKESSGEQSQQSFSQNKSKNLKMETFEEVEEKIRNKNIADEKAIDYLA